MSKNSQKHAFSLAEALITLLIVCLITIASVPIITKKKRMDKTRAQQHGVFACYWDNDGNIIGRYLINDAIAEAETIEDEKEGRMGCKFNPPAGAKNFVVTLVGGGGGGAAGDGEVGNAAWFENEVKTGTSDNAGTSDTDDTVTDESDPDTSEDDPDEGTQVDEEEAATPSYTATSFTAPITGFYDILALGAGGGGGAVSETIGCINDETPAKKWPCGLTGTPGGLVILNQVKLNKGTTLKIRTGAVGPATYEFSVRPTNGGDTIVYVDGKDIDSYSIFAQGGVGGATMNYNGSPNASRGIYDGGSVDSYSVYNLGTIKPTSGISTVYARGSTARYTCRNAAKCQEIMGKHARSSRGGGTLVTGFSQSDDKDRAEFTYKSIDAFIHNDILSWWMYEKEGAYLLDENWKKTSIGFAVQNSGINGGRPYRNIGMNKAVMDRFNISHHEEQAYPFGSGGSGGISSWRDKYVTKSAKDGGRAVVAITWTNAYGGLGGRAGSVIQLPYSELPQGTLVYPGKGGAGEVASDANSSAKSGESSYMKNGPQALGGEGAAKIVKAQPSTYYMVDNDKLAAGQNGELASIAPKTKKAGGAGAYTTEEQNDYMDNTADKNGQTRNNMFLSNSEIGTFNQIVGAGSGGGGGGFDLTAFSKANYTNKYDRDFINKNIRGNGGNGASGIVFIQW